MRPIELTAWTSSMFNYDSSTKEISSVEFVASIVGITVIIKFLHKKIIDKNIRSDCDATVVLNLQPIFFKVDPCQPHEIF